MANPRYSKNAYAKFLGVSAAYYSKLMAGKIMISLDLADSISKILKLSEKERKASLLSVVDEQRCHALYLIDPDYTECDEELDEVNVQPVKRSR